MAKIKFGWSIPSIPSGNDSPPQFFEQINQNLALIHDTFDSVWAYDHFFPPSATEQHTPRMESWTMIAHFSRAFPKLYYGNLVLGQSYRNPALLAKMATTLQWLTGGHLILGIGAGWMEEEYHAYGYDFPKTPVRIQQLEESVQIIRKMWTEPSPTFIGESYQIRDAVCEPRPNPIPPIMIGGNGEKLTLRAVARYADWWNGFSLSRDDVEHKLNVLRSHCENEGRDYDSIVKTWTESISIAETEAEARHTADTSWRSKMRSLELVGTSEQIIEKLRGFTDLGIEHIQLDFVDFPSTKGVTQFMRDVLPAFQ